MRTRSSWVAFTLLAFFFLTLPSPAGAVVNWTNRTQTDLGPGPTGAWDDYETLVPDVIKDGTTYKMWYTGKSSAGPYQIGYATSVDGFTWTKHGVTPIIVPAEAGTWDGLAVQHIGNCSVIKNGSLYEMWYSATTNATGDGGGQIGYATSNDGITWAHHGSPVLMKGPAGDWDADSVNAPAVIYDNGTYRMWYTGHGPGWPGIGYATSPDGITWTKWNNANTGGSPYVSSDPVIKTGPNRSWNGSGLGSPTVVKEDTKFHLWFRAHSGDPADDRERIGYAYNPYAGAGLNWIPYSGNPLLHPGAPTAYDAGGVTDPTVIKDGNTYKMWYYGAGTGAPGTPRGKINYAESSAYQGNTLAIDRINLFARYESSRSGIQAGIQGRFPSPLDITQCTVSGPNGLYLFLADGQLSSDGKNQRSQSFDYFFPITGGVTPAYSGTYTFTLKTNNGLTITKSVDLAVSFMAAPSETFLDRYVNATPGTNVYAGTATPTLKWKPALGDNYYYRAYVMDWTGNSGWYFSDWLPGSSKGGDGYLSVTVPAGYLKADTPYKWKIQIADTCPVNRVNSFNRVDTSSPHYTFYTGTKGTGNFLSGIVLDRTQSAIEGGTTLMVAVVANLAPWDITDLHVENETYAPPYYYTFAPATNTADAYTTDHAPFSYLKLLNGPDLANTSLLGYKFFVSDGSNSSEMYAQYVTPSGAKPQLTRDQMAPQDKAYAQTLEPTLTWKSEGTDYTYRVMIIDWRNFHQPYKSDYLPGLAAGQDMSVTVPAGVLQGSYPYRWFVDTLDSGKYNRVRTEMLSFMTPPASSLYAAFTGGGIWKWNGSVWSQITPSDPQSIRTSGATLYGDFGTGGIWKWDGSAWSQVTPSDPQSFRVEGSILYGDFGTGGIWKWDGGAWSQVTPSDPENMAVSGPILYGDYGTGGIWKWDGGVWSQVTPSDPQNMAVSGPILYCSFASGGLWKWDGYAWSQLTPSDPQSIRVAGLMLYVDFGAGGIWQWDGSAWGQITPADPESMASTGSILHADFGTGGIWQWDGSAWSQISPSDPQSMTGGL